MTSLLDLTKSKLRARILLLFFSHPEKEYYLRELERKLKKPVAYIRRELVNLEKMGLFVSETKGKERYFRLNFKYPLYKEIKKIIAKTIGVEGSFKNILRKFKGIRLAFLFGSYAEQKEDLLSDIDLMIVGNLDENMLLSEIDKLEDELGREINYHIYSLADWKKKIKENNYFIKNVLSKPRISLVESEDELSRFNR